MGHPCIVVKQKLKNVQRIEEKTQNYCKQNCSLKLKLEAIQVNIVERKSTKLIKVLQVRACDDNLSLIKKMNLAKHLYSTLN